MTNAVIYARYSPGPNQTDQSIEGQIHECTRFCEDNDLRIVGTYIDRKQTGRNDNRADFQKMLRDSSRHGFSTVVVWKIDRFGRNREEIAKNKAVLRMNGVRVLSAKEHIPDGPEGIILESVLEGLAEYYSANLSQNIKRGMRESALKCQFNGSGLSTGYTVDADHKYRIDPDGAAVVRTIFEMYDGGKKIADILRYLQQSNIKTMRGKEYTHYGISRILRNRVYIGEYHWHDIVVPGGVPQIIDNDLFDRVQKRLEVNKHAPAARRGDVDFLLTSKLICGNCKSTMIGDCGTGKNGARWYYYTCRAKKTKSSKCRKKSVPKEALEREITALTAAYVLRDDVIDYIANKVVEIQKSEHDDKSMLRYFESQLKDTNKAIANIMRAIEAGIITETTRSRLEELEDTKRDLETEIIKEKVARPTIEREQVIFFLEKFRGGNVDDKEYQRKIIDTFVHKVILYDDKITITYNYSTDSTKNAENTVESIESAASAAECKCSNKPSSSPPMTRILLLRCSCYFFRRGSNRTVLRSRIPSVRWTVGKSACVSAHDSAPSDPLRLHQ